MAKIPAPSARPADMMQRDRQTPSTASDDTPARALLDEAATGSAGDRLRAHWRGELERWAVVSAHLPLGGGSRVDAALAFVRRAARYLLRWYINPIVEQQNQFNAAAVSLDALDRARERELARELDDLRARVAHLEAQLLRERDQTTTPGPSAR